MAEILLSLTIIGVVAAITLPSLTGNINERTWNTQRKALYARFSQAIALMPALNGYGTVTEATSSTSAVDTAAETFITNGLAKVLKINNICDNTHLNDCGIVDSYTNLKASIVSMPKTLTELHSTLTSRAAFNISGASFPEFNQSNVNAAAFETTNGESIILFYNPNCVSMLGENGSNLVMQTKMCINMIYDLNGSKGPNTIGKDMGIMAVFYPTDSLVVSPVPYINDADGGATFTAIEADGKCSKMDRETRLPNREELVTMYINANSIGKTGRYWSSTRTVEYNRTVRWTASLTNGVLGWDSISNTTNAYKVMCVKR